MRCRGERTVGWIAVFVGVAVLMAALPVGGHTEECPACCYEDVTVHVGEFVLELEYSGSLNEGRPVFYAWPDTGDCWVSAGMQYGDIVGWHDYGDVWWLYVAFGCEGEFECYVAYTNTYATARTPPEPGWRREHLDWNCPAEWYNQTPLPSVSGGEACDSGGELIPARVAGFLDRGWPDDDPPVVGELPISATYEVGELITGCCAVEDSMGYPGDVPYVILTWYAATPGEDFDVREPLDTHLLYDEEGAYCFTISTDEFTPGYYDIRLGVPFMDQQWIRVEVVPPPE